jgi:hypothetical protein
MDNYSRPPLMGVKNIIRFNWHFYAMGIAVFSCLLALGTQFPGLQGWFWWVAMLLLLPLLASLLVSYYVYDYSGLYQLHWLKPYMPVQPARLINIHFGFDETSQLLALHWPAHTLMVLDCFDAAKHTELSIQRARAWWPAYPGTITASTHALPLQAHTANVVLLLFAAHEIRDTQERVVFFTQLKQALAPGGRIIVMEHLRDVPNALAYTIGVFHFLSLSSWKHTFAAAGLSVAQQQQLNPFIQLFILTANDTTY